MPGWMANSVGLYWASGVTGLAQVNARVSSKRGVFARSGSGSLDGVSESLRRYWPLSAVLRGLPAIGGSGVIFLAMEIFLFSKGVRHISLPSEGVANCTQVGKPVNRNRQAEASCAQPAITRTQTKKPLSRRCAPTQIRVTKPDR